MTIAQQLEQKGLEKGLEPTRIEGEREATLKIARSMLLKGLEQDTIMNLTVLGAKNN
ncbi:hypothetical protein ERHA54_50550 (plasmid) [Erwinia rhapontici]|nr:hypothetical protein ERHA54_50550 [Erwinia rhapontici]